MKETSEYYNRMIGKLLAQQLHYHIKQLQKHGNPSEYIESLIAKIINQTSNTAPWVLNELGMIFFKGSEGIKKDINLASECFSFAFGHGITVAGLNLATTLFCLSTDLNYGIRLFYILEKTMKKGCAEFKTKRNDIYYLGGLLFFRAQNKDAAKHCFGAVRRSHAYYASAQEYIEKINNQNLK